MRKIKVWIATLSLLLVLSMMVLPSQALADPPDPQGAAQPAPPPPPPPPPIYIIIWGVIMGLIT